jgi:hypothetical protein
VNEDAKAGDEARQHQWLGEVSALEESLIHLRRRRDEMHSQARQDFPESAQAAET